MHSAIESLSIIFLIIGRYIFFLLDGRDNCDPTFHSFAGEYLKLSMFQEIDSCISRQIGESHVFRVSSPFTLIRFTRRHSNFLSRGIPLTGKCGWVLAQKIVIFGAISCFAVRPASNDPCPPRMLRLSVAKEVLVPCRDSSQSPALKTEVVHNIVAVGSTTPPPSLPTFFFSQSAALSRARSTDPFFN